MQRFPVLVIALLILSFPIWAQSPTATIDGRVLDASKAVIEGVRVDATNIDTNVRYSTQTNSAGLFTIVNLPPGSYRIEVSKPGFRTIVNPMIVLHVQDVVALNFNLPVGSVTESITISGGAPLVNTEDATVSTVVDRNFAENLPMNGRSFQTLIQLTPGVVLTPSSASDSGQFSVSGQRAASNYWMLDGVSANIGIGANATGTPGNGLGGTLGSFSASGGTNSLVSVDAMQEFRIQTSTYAPEFGRTPGGQISIITRSGTNRFHGTAFDYVRNDKFDANDWFANQNNLPKPKERQNDFGGTFSGPIIRGGTFFFFSYEGLRLRLPQVTLSTVPDLAARRNGAPALQPFLNAFPLPNGQDDAATGTAQFNASYSNAATLDAYSFRVDHKVKDNLSLFGRYDYSPSQSLQRGAGGSTLNSLSPSRITTQTTTLGNTWTMTKSIVNDLRFNYSRVTASAYVKSDNFGGATPLSAPPIPNGLNSQNSLFFFNILSLPNGIAQEGVQPAFRQQQINLVDGLSMQRRTHTLKFGLDYRQLFPRYDPQAYFQAVFFNDVSSAQSGNLLLSAVESNLKATFLFRNLGMYGQDTWRLAHRLTLTYGLRWDVDFVPESLNGPSLPAVRGFNLNNLSNLALAPKGTSPYGTRYDNLAPRIGIAYEVRQNPDWGTVFRGGFGLFYDLATSEAGNNIPFGAYPFGSAIFTFGGTFPLTPAMQKPAPITADNLSSGLLNAYDPNLRLPRTFEWNTSVEQGLGKEQTLSVSYVGASGRRLLQTAFITAPNPAFGFAQLVTNAGVSNYNALQLQFQRRLARGLQALASYSWSHSIDTGSAGSAFGNGANALVPSTSGESNRGSSDFDIRNSFSAAVTYSIPAFGTQRFAKALFEGWSLQNIVQLRTAPPVNVFDGAFSILNNGSTQIRPDLVKGIPLYLYGTQYPGGKAVNNAPNLGGPGCIGPFCPPPTGSNGNPSRQGDLGRNALRGFGAAQWDLAVHRDFQIHESLKLQFRAEIFNIVNHPNFGPPVGDLSNMQFGRSTQMLGQSLVGFGNAGAGAFSPLYQLGGPRSIQLALKLMF
jgi:hypothetical protein